jgi:hypothetical protein
MPARKTFWGGYAGYFQGPDGHLWEVLHNPAFLPDADRQARAALAQIHPQARDEGKTTSEAERHFGACGLGYGLASLAGRRITA